jgi:ABC-2 type transport system ATP-binding protein
LAENIAIHLFELIKTKGNKVVIKKNLDFTNNDIIQYFIQKGLNIQSFNEMLPSLNDIFIRLVQGTPETRQFQ